MTTIGITTTVPTEVLLAAGYQPVDLNNLFISDPDPERLVDIAERAGFPINCCTWIKGIYGVVMDQGIDTVLCVTSGDCSNTIMLMEVLKLKGCNVIPFSYPAHPDVSQMQYTLDPGAAIDGESSPLGDIHQSLGIRVRDEEIIQVDRLIACRQQDFCRDCGGYADGGHLPKLYSAAMPG